MWYPVEHHISALFPRQGCRVSSAKPGRTVVQQKRCRLQCMIKVADLDWTLKIGSKTFGSGLFMSDLGWWAAAYFLLGPRFAIRQLKTPTSRQCSQHFELSTKTCIDRNSDLVAKMWRRHDGGIHLDTPYIFCRSNALILLISYCEPLLTLFHTTVLPIKTHIVIPPLPTNIHP